MVNIYEPLINVVTENKPKVLFSPTRTLGLGQKARGQVWVLVRCVASALTHRRCCTPGGEAEPNLRRYLHGTW
jgi:hypothetical protein